MFYVNNGNMFRVQVDLNTEYFTLNRFGYGFNLKNDIKISICQYGYVVSIFLKCELSDYWKFLV